jgi:hypothetical protein
MATSFKREVKMKTTEPSVDEVGKGMKRGGHAKHKADGGMAMMARPGPALARQAMRPTIRKPAMPIMRKEGGETKAMHAAEMKKMSKVEHELKSHESKPASKAHHGLKKGGTVERVVPGGLLPGVTKVHGSGVTGGVRSPGYKKGGGVGPYVNTKVVDDAKGNAVKKKGTGGVEAPGYKKGGSIAAYAKTKMHDDASGHAVKKKGTGSLELSKFKDGGHVAMSCHSTGGFTANKKMSKC